ncbi:MAG TPA: YebC/PmpR family DNA-binding transcriptional regulator [Saprospiraceae bacterium]|nr:YebC/PmpR family DNA-binding transcriptional regulator [Saprospiraceae bacterium]HMV23790.1 YebC/PmpR family DNA-binding transcriptional regulator [Saprospiraceae bacterium]HMW75314.1 YebC/PmpR family DNA-binding transcriptional regulator [Saprospiraceae bacterium]HMZ73717.1 YebC/PmpR family DNA-binding transcriptional regulator [Saprospiraceae bacterium]HNE65904.1 YebC/PmpR family DNA-binding transcriptional regulator [Saprospiraceae bacterium]
MGRAFEFRKERKFKRWGKMAKSFTKVGKEIAIAVKNGSADPETNPKLRLAIQNAKACNMPKENVERAIKKASSKDAEDLKAVTYEGYGPYGVAVFIDALTDNTTRTVANVRSYFNKGGGSLGTSGSLDFLFDKKCAFKVNLDPNTDMDEFELEAIDYGIDSIEGDEEGVFLYGTFEEFGNIQKFLEDKGIEIITAEFERIPTDLKELTEAQQEEIMKMINRMEEDDDVLNVFHNMKYSGEE